MTFEPADAVDGPRGATSTGATGGTDALSMTALMATLTSINNPLMSQVLLNTNKPQFQGTMSQFPEFVRQWKDYKKILLTLQPGMPEGQLLVLFKNCLDNTTATQLQRAMDRDSNLTVRQYLNTMAETFGQDAVDKPDGLGTTSNSTSEVQP